MSIYQREFTHLLLFDKNSSTFNVDMPNRTASVKQFGFGTPIIIFIVLLLGVAGGYWYGRIYSKTPSSINKAPSIVSVPDKTSSTATKVITNTQIKWGSLVTETIINIKVMGEVTKNELTKQKIYDGRTIDGHKITLKKENNDITYFVSIGANVFEGDVNKFDTWKKINLSDFQPGDTVILRVEAPLQADVSSESYVGVWAFKQL